MGKSLAIKIISILFYLIFGISILFTIIFAINMNEELLIIWTYILGIIAVASTLVFAILQMFKSKKSMLTSFGVIAVFGILILVSYLLSSSAMPNFLGVDSFKLTPTVLKWVDTSLHLLYILLGASFFGLIFSEVRNAFN